MQVCNGPLPREILGDKFDCCCTMRACNYGTLEMIFNVMKMSMYPAHIRDFGSVNSMINNLHRLNLTDYQLLRLNNSSDLLLNPYPLIPLCKYQDEWGHSKSSESKLILNNQTVEFCSLFRPSYTDSGICYTFNGNKNPAENLKDGVFKKTFSKVFGAMPEAETLYYPNGIGTKNGLYLIIDTHVTEGKFMQGKNKNPIFKLSLHTDQSFPLIGLEGLEIEAGFKTTIVTNPWLLISTNDVYSLDIEGETY